MVLFLVNAHQIDIRAPVSLQSCGGRKVIAPPFCVHQDCSWARQSLKYIFVSAVSERRQWDVKVSQIKSTFWSACGTALHLEVHFFAFAFHN
jgi:hypothetical protein